MSPQPSRYREIIIRTVPRPISGEDIVKQQTRRHRGADAGSEYDLLIYTDLPVPDVGPPSNRPLPPGQHQELAGLPLAAIEPLVIQWGSYEDYLGAFVEGGKDAVHMRDRLIETLPLRLQMWLNNAPTTDPVRLWTDSSTPELVELPWELVLTTAEGAPRWFDFVRGLPPDPAPPLVPLAGPLRLALLCTNETRPHALIDRLQDIPEIELIEFTSAPREALQQIAQKGYELLHIVADGYPTLAYDTVLSFHGGDSPELPVSELSARLRGSRLSALGLTPARPLEPNLSVGSRQNVPSVYRACSHLGATNLPLPSMVLPLGPTPEDRLTAFWGAYYAAMSETLSIEDAVTQGRAASLGPWTTPAPLALFLRHRHGRLFRRDDSERSFSLPEAPTLLNAELEASKALVSRLQATMKSQSGAIPESVRTFIAAETEHQDRLSADLDTWSTLEVGEE